jgi:exonuclease VII small subunit
VDPTAHDVLKDVHRDIEDAAEQISQAVTQIESGEVASSEALLSEAHTRLKLLAQRVDALLARDR